MARKKYKPEKNVAKLRQVDVLSSQCMPREVATQNLGATERIDHAISVCV